MTDPRISIASVSGSPTDEEVAAIVAALELSWPQAIAIHTKPDRAVRPWRFAARSWVAQTEREFDSVLRVRPLER